MAFYIADKPRGITSFDVVHRFRKELGIKKVGHTGTLDPLATGLMLIATGVSTKLIQYCDTHDKTYEADIRLDGISETDDKEGPIVDLDPIAGVPTQDEIQSLINVAFLGKKTQIPPKYSALKIDGKRAYERARSGENVHMKSRSVTIYSHEILSYSFPFLKVRIRVSAGTYIRSIARSLGEMTTGGGYLTGLRRIQVSHISIDHPKLVTDLYKITDENQLTYQEIFPHFLYINGLTENQRNDLFLGKKTNIETQAQKGTYFIDYGESIGLVSVDDQGLIKVLKNNV